jgi:hypothetical protein
MKRQSANCLIQSERLLFLHYQVAARWISWAAGCIDQTADRRSGDVVLLRSFRQTHSRQAVSNNLYPVDVERRMAYSSPFQFRSTHSGSNALNDQASFELRYRSHDC